LPRRGRRLLHIGVDLDDVRADVLGLTAGASSLSSLVVVGLVVLDRVEGLGRLEHSLDPGRRPWWRGGENLVTMLTPEAAHVGYDLWSAGGIVFHLERRKPACARNGLSGQIAEGEHVQHRWWQAGAIRISRFRHWTPSWASPPPPARVSIVRPSAGRHDALVWDPR